MNRKCFWPGCEYRLGRHYTAANMYCHSHRQALGPELAERLRKAHGTDDWMSALEACQHQARETIRWVKTEVTGGSTC